MAHGLLSRHHRHISGISAQANRISTIERGVRMTQLRQRNMFPASGIEFSTQIKDMP
jgi:hypothetical protein